MMFKKALHILTKTYNGIYILVGLALLILGATLYFLLGRQAADSLIEQMLHREQVVARAGSNTLLTFFNLFGKSLITIGGNPLILRQDDQRREMLSDFFGYWKNTPVSGIGLTNEKGVFIFSDNKAGESSVGVNVADRDYFLWAKTAKRNEFFVGHPVQSRTGGIEGQYIIPVATSVLDEQGNFKGVLIAALLIKDMAEAQINHLKISDMTRVYLIDNEGVIISGPAHNLVGLNYIDYLKKPGVIGGAKSAEILSSVLSSGKEGKLDIALPDETKNGILTRYLVAYSPVHVGNEQWVLAVATPANDALLYLTPFYFKGLGFAGLLLFAFLIITIRVSKIFGYVEGIEMEHKIHKKLPSEE